MLYLGAYGPLEREMGGGGKGPTNIRNRDGAVDVGRGADGGQTARQPETASA